MTKADTTSSIDQPPPVPNSSAPIWELVIADMRERDQVGRARYGTPLQAHNGRDALADAYAEALDLAVYLKQAMVERDAATAVIKTGHPALMEAFESAMKRAPRVLVAPGYVDEPNRADVLSARHQVATAHGAIVDIAGHIARALAWQVGDEPAVVADLEAALLRISPAQRLLHEAIAALRRAASTSSSRSNKEDGADV